MSLETALLSWISTAFFSLPDLLGAQRADIGTGDRRDDVDARPRNRLIEQQRTRANRRPLDELEQGSTENDSRQLKSGDARAMGAFRGMEQTPTSNAGFRRHTILAEAVR